jgi:hypothetical protein
MAEPGSRGEVVIVGGGVAALETLMALQPFGLGEARRYSLQRVVSLLVERCHGILTDIRTGGTYDLTTLPVALRELRNLLQGSAAGAGGPA